MTKKENEENQNIAHCTNSVSSLCTKWAPHGNSEFCLTTVLMEVGLEGLVVL